MMSLIDGLGLSTEIPNGYCFYCLFDNCTSLTKAPELPATTLAEGCYEYMFAGCTSLTQAPELPATTLAEDCYWGMFAGCTSLTQAPELPATTLAEGCYGYMFYGCTSLSQIRVSFDDWVGGIGTESWVIDVAPTGTFICQKVLPIALGNSGIPPGWKFKNIIDGDTVDVTFNHNFLTFTAEEDGSTFGIANREGNPDVHYSLDGGETWTALAEGDRVTLAHIGDKALLAGTNPYGFSKKRDEYSSFTMSGKIAASGSVMSLIDGAGLSTEIPEDYSFSHLFSGCKSLTQAPELPATALAEYCYCEMFSGCTSLTQAPELPAITLANSCYDGMFKGCTSLTQVPELPATSLAGGCYDGMFSGCTSLTKAPELPAITLANSCYDGMFKGCTSLTQAPELPATTLANYCYDGMFSGCKSLTQAPELPASTLADNCYAWMFAGCTNLTQISVSFDDWGGTSGWVSGVAPTGTFICPKALEEKYGVSWIPEGWTVKYIDDNPTEVSAVAADGMNVWTEGLTITVSGATGRVEVFDASGAKLKSESSAGDACTFTMPAHGVYLVRTSKRTVKVVL